MILFTLLGFGLQFAACSGAYAQDAEQSPKIPQSTYEGAVQELSELAKSDEMNDVSNPFRLQKTRDEWWEHHRKSQLQTRIVDWTCEVKFIGVGLSPFTDRSNSQEQIGFDHSGKFGILCEREVTYLLVFDDTAEKSDWAATLSIGDEIRFTGEGIGRRAFDMTTLIHVDGAERQ